MRTLYRPDDLGAAQNDPLRCCRWARWSRWPCPARATSWPSPGLLAKSSAQMANRCCPIPPTCWRPAPTGAAILRLAAQGRWAVPNTDPDDQLVDPLRPSVPFARQRRHRRAGTGPRPPALLPAAPLPRSVPHQSVQHRDRRHLRRPQPAHGRDPRRAGQTRSTRRTTIACCSPG